MDRQWWKIYHAEAAATFHGELVAPIVVPHAGVRSVKFRGCRTSGEGAIALAAFWGAQRVVLVGYDCQHTGGRAHWHPDHPGLGNARGVEKWPEQMRALARFLGIHVQVINASRVTALEVFPRQSLEAALGECNLARIRERAPPRAA